MKVTRRVRRTYTASIDDFNVELTFDPVNDDDILYERVGHRLVIGYLVQDDHPSNPMKEFDGQGDFYTSDDRGSRSEVYSALGLDIYGDIDIDKEFEAPEPWLDHNQILQVSTTLRDLAADQFMETVKGDLDLQQRFLEHAGTELVEGQDYQIDLKALRRDLVDSYGYFCEEIEELARNLFPQHWRTMAGPYVVPVHYCSSNHGPGTASASVEDWDGDLDDTPNAVWVADGLAAENIATDPLPRGVDVKYDTASSLWVVEQPALKLRRCFEVTAEAFEYARSLGPGDVAWSAERYAKGVLDEYVSWCNGDVYGCVVEVFDFDPSAAVTDIEEAIADGDGEWEQIEEESCWGFIGYDHALESLKTDFFEPALAHQKGRTTTTVQLPPGALQLTKD